MAVASAEGGRVDLAGRVTPTAAEARELAKEHNLIPVSQTFIEDTETPVSAFLKLRGWGSEETPGQASPSFLLESADHGRVGRYSFIGFRPRQVLRWSLGEGGDA
jgi:anthranilate synthase component 1